MADVNVMDVNVMDVNVMDVNMADVNVTDVNMIDVNMIDAKNLSVKLGGNDILQNVSAQIKCGNITAILGPNGAGKSTLLKCLTGWQKTDAGTIMLDGKPISDYSLFDLSLKRAVLSQSNPINFPFTALEIVMMGRNPYTNNNTARKDYDVVLEALGYMDAAHLKERIFPTLSGGEQQRVHLARILAQLWDEEYAYLFLDEPTSALDLKHQHQLLRLLSSLAKEKHFALCVIMHDLNLAMRYAHQVILLKEGKLFASGVTNQILCAEHIEDVFQIPANMVLGQKAVYKS